MQSWQDIFPSLHDHSVLAALPNLDWAEQHESTRLVLGNVHPSCVIANNVSIGQGSIIDPFVVIESNVSIGKNCHIRSGALIRANTILQDKVVVGHGAEVKNAFVFSEAKIASHTFVGDSILGAGARIGSGVIIGNRRFDQKEIAWQLNNEKIPSGLDKLGALIGDYARLGANVTTNPGTVIGAYTWISGGQSISGYIPHKKFIKPNGAIVDNLSETKLSSTDSSGNR